MEIPHDDRSAEEGIQTFLIMSDHRNSDGEDLDETES